MKDAAMIGSNYDRIENDAYFTIEEWPTNGLIEKLGQYYPKTDVIWEPACGMGHMTKVIQDHGYRTVSTDIKNWGYKELEAVEDFTETTKSKGDHVITNPPYEKKDAEAFVRHAVKLIDEGELKSAAMLMRNEWDSASGRIDLFTDCPYFHSKLVLLKRPRWFEKRENDKSPRHNYSWFYWSAAKSFSNNPSSILYYKP